ncbi:MAG TPA: WG repeat-containing protein [Acidobacteriaceae bacterium]|jgi:hypothetical protein|nr:WG repeat-containing protein [Acidobacteriaceae bacterium]
MRQLSLAVLILVLLIRSIPAQVIRSGNCTVDYELLQLPACALETHNGKLYLSKPYLQLFFSPTGKSLATGTPGNLASTYLPDEGWAYLDHTGLVVVRNVAVMDNGANAFHYELVRITRSGKWGLADIHGKIVVPFTYDGMLDYQKGQGWPACTGCSYVHQGEYGYFRGGKWVALTRQGKAGLPIDPPLGSQNPKPHN